MELSLEEGNAVSNICSTDKWSDQTVILGVISQAFLFCISFWQLSCTPLAFVSAAYVISAAVLKAKLYGVQPSLQMSVQNSQEAYVQPRA